MNDSSIGCICYLVFFIIILIFSYFIDNFSCHKTAKTLNYSCEYSIWTGCVLENKNGDKFLLDQLREMK